MKLSTRPVVAVIVAAACLAIPASASAMPYSPPATAKSDAAQSGDDGNTTSTIQPQTGTSIQPDRALALVLAMLAITLVRSRLVPRPGRSH